jgi:hypothetical protein
VEKCPNVKLCPFLTQFITFFRGKNIPKIWPALVKSKKTMAKRKQSPKENNRPIVENFAQCGHPVGRYVGSS